jgi:hypothetical protein
MSEGKEIIIWVGGFVLFFYIVIALLWSSATEVSVYDVYVNINGVERHYESEGVTYYPSTISLWVNKQTVKVPKHATIVEFNRTVQPPIPKMFNIFGVYKEEK